MFKNLCLKTEIGQVVNHNQNKIVVTNGANQVINFMFAEEHGAWLIENHSSNSLLYGTKFEFNG
jgi:hypothetical protein